jgi:Flavodoxins
MKKTLILFASKGQVAKKVAFFVANWFQIDNDSVINLSECSIDLNNIYFEHVILICPTYGDEELEENMENCLINTSWSLHQGKTFSIVELGLYRGYEITELGAGRIIQYCLEKNGLKKTTPTLSLDSVYSPPMELLEKWLIKNFFKNA